ncbi:MAG: nitroreductase family protein [Desulfobacteraceae bacterium]|nr:nitroreductase family protein [Desulfobacteraceae bacterium]
MITIDSAKCTKCGLCIDVCPNYVLSSNSESGETEIRHPDQCCICGHCVAVCPESAIDLEEMASQRFEDLADTKIPPENMKSFLQSRRSIRAFKEKAVSRELLEQLIETGIHAGTSSNGQTEGFIIIEDQNTLAELEQIVINVLWNSGLKYLGSSIGMKFTQMRYGHEMCQQYMAYHNIIKNLKRSNQLKGMVFRNAPAVIVIHGIRANYLTHANCAIATRNMEIMAKSMSLGTCWVGFLTSAAHMSRKICKYLGIPADRNIYGAIMVGYPKHRYTKSIPRRSREVRWI